MGATRIDEGALIDFLLSGSIENTIQEFLPLGSESLPSVDVTCKEELLCILGPKDEWKSTYNGEAVLLQGKEQATATKKTSLDKQFVRDLKKAFLKPSPKVRKESSKNRKNNSKNFEQRSVPCESILLGKHAVSAFENKSFSKDARRSRAPKMPATHKHPNITKLNEIPVALYNQSSQPIAWGNKHYVHQPDVYKGLNRKEKFFNGTDKKIKQESVCVATSVEQGLPQTDDSEAASTEHLNKSSEKIEALAQGEKSSKKKLQNKEKKKQKRAARREAASAASNERFCKVTSQDVHEIFTGQPEFDTERIKSISDLKKSRKNKKKNAKPTKNTEPEFLNSFKSPAEIPTDSKHGYVEKDVEDKLRNGPKKTGKNKKKKKKSPKNAKDAEVDFTTNTDISRSLAFEELAAQHSLFFTEEALLDEPTGFASDRTLSFESCTSLSVTNPKSKKKKNKKASKHTESSPPIVFEFASNAKDSLVQKPQLQKPKAKKSRKAKNKPPKSLSGGNDSMTGDQVLTNSEIEKLLLRTASYDDFDQSSATEQFIAKEESRNIPMTGKTTSTSVQRLEKKSRRKKTKNKTKDSTEKST
ncbi:hypothetical protein ACO0QE_004803 [Hanseniaspora vineae]